VVRQIDQSRPQPAQKFAPKRFYRWLEKQGELVERVVVCYEAAALGMSWRAGCKRWEWRST
jgi:hypothetical protein